MIEPGRSKSFHFVGYMENLSCNECQPAVTKNPVEGYLNYTALEVSFEFTKCIGQCIGISPCHSL